MKSVSLKFGKLNVSKEENQAYQSKMQQFKYKTTTDEHPYLIFGRGINGWLALIEQLIIVFFPLSIIAIIQMYLFRLQSPHYLSNHTFTINRAISSVSLGALIQSRPRCASVPMNLDVIRAHCSGKNVIIDILDVGVTHMDSSDCYLPRGDDGKPK